MVEGVLHAQLACDGERGIDELVRRAIAWLASTEETWLLVLEVRVPVETLVGRD